MADAEKLTEWWVEPVRPGAGARAELLAKLRVHGLHPTCAADDPSS